MQCDKVPFFSTQRKGRSLRGEMVSREDEKTVDGWRLPTVKENGKGQKLGYAIYGKVISYRQHKQRMVDQ